MSADATGWVYGHSPYTGVTFQVHHAVADSVNDQNGNEFWMTKPKLAIKARTSVASAKRAMETMVADGFLEQLTESGGRGPSRYVFLFPDVPVIYDARSTGSPRTGSPGTSNRVKGDTQPGHQESPTGSPGTENAPYKEGSQENPKGTQEEPNARADFFAAFWKVYPRKTDKGGAKKAWPRAVKAVGGDEDRIVQAAYRYGLDPNLPELQFVPHASTWLNGERWEDAPMPPRKSTGPPPPGPSRLSPTDDALMRAQDTDPSFNPEDF